MASHVLRFVAVMDTNYSVDMSRRFIVSFYLSDDTIAVFEPPQRNSGVLGGQNIIPQATSVPLPYPLPMRANEKNTAPK